MRERFQKANALDLPIIDQKDCNQRCQVMLTPLNQLHQHNAEFTQSSYNRLRSMENAYKTTNYMFNIPKQQTGRVIIQKKTIVRGGSVRSPSKKSNLRIPM